MGSKPYKDKDTLVELYIEKGMSQTEIGEKYGVTAATISYWLNKNDIPTPGGGPKVQYPKLRDKNWLREEYIRKQKSSRDIAEELGADKSVVLKGLRKCGIERRDTPEATMLGMDTGHCSFRTEKLGYEVVTSRTPEEKSEVRIHQLVAIAEGEDPHNVFSGGDYHVHHENNIQWDNRPGNLELKTNSEHMKGHAETRADWGQ